MTARPWPSSAFTVTTATARTTQPTARRRCASSNACAIWRAPTGTRPPPSRWGSADKQGLTHHAIAMGTSKGSPSSRRWHRACCRATRARSTRRTPSSRPRCIIDAVNACDRRVVHRDISPANIILTMTRTGDVNRAVLIDWGAVHQRAKPACHPPRSARTASWQPSASARRACSAGRST